MYKDDDTSRPGSAIAPPPRRPPMPYERDMLPLPPPRPPAPYALSGSIVAPEAYLYGDGPSPSLLTQSDAPVGHQGLGMRHLLVEEVSSVGTSIFPILGCEPAIIILVNTRATVIL